MTQRGTGLTAAATDVAAMREAATALVHGVYRLVKASLFYTDATNDAITALTTSTAAAVVQFCRSAASESASITFIGDAVFVNGQILKSSRETHSLTEELRGMLEVCDVTELTFKADVSRDALSKFARLLVSVSRDHSRAQELAAGDITGITARKAVFAGAGMGEAEPPAVRASRTYALSVLTLQRILSGTQSQDLEHARLVKRIAQRIVGHVDDDGRLLVALAAVAGASSDPAVIAVGSAILAVAMLRQLTSDRSLLSNAAAAALLLDAAKLSLARSSDGPIRTLNDDELDQVPARSVALITAMSRMHAPARLRTVLVYEGWLQRRAHRRGPPYGGKRTLTVLSRILATARAFSELRAADSDGKLTIDDAIQLLTNRAADGTERAFVRLLVGALGIFPAGTMVELSTGELAVVMGTPAAPVDYVRPQVKILYDQNAVLLDEPLDLDLAAPRPPGAPLRFVRRNIDADDQQLKAMRSYVLAATAAARRGALDPALVPEAPARGEARPRGTHAVTEIPPPRKPEIASAPPTLAAPLTGNAEPSASEGSAPSSPRRAPRPILPRTDSPYPATPASMHSPHGAPRAEDPPSSGPPSKAAPVRPAVTEQAPPARRRERRPIVPRTDTPVATQAPPVDVVGPAPVLVASPETLAAEQARAAKMTESMPPTGLRGAIFGGRAPEPSEPRRLPPQQVPTQPEMPEVASPPAPAEPSRIAQATREVNWHDYGKLVNADKIDTVRKLAAQKDRPVRTVHDDLLAAFLADEPLPTSDPPAAGEPEDQEEPPKGGGSPGT